MKMKYLHIAVCVCFIAILGVLKMNSCEKHNFPFRLYAFQSEEIESFVNNFILQEKDKEYYREDMTFECELYKDSANVILLVGSGFAHSTGIGDEEDDYGVVLVGDCPVFLDAADWGDYVEALNKEIVLPVLSEEVINAEATSFHSCEIESEYRAIRFAKINIIAKE